MCEHKATNPPFLTPINLLGRVCGRPHLVGFILVWTSPQRVDVEEKKVRGIGKGGEKHKGSTDNNIVTFLTSVLFFYIAKTMYNLTIK